MAGLTSSPHGQGMQEKQVVMLDPATDDVLSVCTGPTADGRCPVADEPPYVCAGLHLLAAGAPGEERWLSGVELEPGAARWPSSSADPAAAHALARRLAEELV